MPLTRRPAPWAGGNGGESPRKEGTGGAVSWEHGRFRPSVAPPAVAGRRARGHCVSAGAPESLPAAPGFLQPQHQGLPRPWWQCPAGPLGSLRKKIQEKTDLLPYLIRQGLRPPYLNLKRNCGLF